MTITEDMLYAAAPEAAERFLSSLPDRADCGHEFSDAFSDQMERLLQHGPPRRRRHWRALLAAAAVLAALTAGLAVGAGSQPDCQVYWSESDGVVQYSVRIGQETTRPFSAASITQVPQGFSSVRETSDGEAEYSIIYQAPDGRTFSLYQICAQEYNGMFSGNCTASEVSVGDHLGMLAEDADGGWKRILWTDGPYIFSLYGTGLSKSELLEIAQHITW